MYRIGVDIGGTTVKIGLVNDSYRITARSVIPFPHTTAEDMAEQLTAAIRALCAENGAAPAELDSVGVVVPGSIDPAGETVIDAYNLGFHNVPLKKLLQERLPETELFLANDANGAALAELAGGAFEGCKTAVLLTLGTGVGGGIILNGHMFNGGCNQGVELGHVILADGGDECTCGNRGCIEAYCAATSLIRYGVREMEKRPGSLLYQKAQGKAENVDAKLVTDCARDGDQAAILAFNEFTDHLSSACASIFNLLDPEVIAIGGGLSGAGDFLFRPLEVKTTKKCFYHAHGPVVAAKMGNDAGIIGAAMLKADAAKG